MNYKILLTKLAILSLLVLGLSAILFTVEQLPITIVPFFPFIVLYFFLLSAFQFYRIGKFRSENVRTFHTKYTMWFGIKLFVNLAVVVTFVLLDKSMAKDFLIYFLTLYVVYTIFDTLHLSKIVKK